MIRATVLCVSLVGVLAAVGAQAADQGVTGKKLLLKSTPKLVLLSKDPSISIAGSDPIGGADSSVSFDLGGGPVTFNLPSSLWTANGTGTLFKYKNAAAPGGPSAVKVAKIKPGLLKVVAKGVPFAVPNGAATIDVVFSLAGGTNTYCMTFSGIGNGDKFLVKDAAAGSCGGSPVATPTPTSTAAATGTPTRTPTNTPVSVACGDSGYPTCGGTCPAGQVCESVVDAGCNCLGEACGAVQDCRCVPVGGTCGGFFCTVNSCGIPPSACTTPLTYGPCPAGQDCVTVGIGTAVQEVFQRGCGFWPPPF